jgi:hypothetical protein
MAKRIIAAILGGIAAFGSLLPLGYAFEVFRDYPNPDGSLRGTALVVLLFSSIAVTGFVIGFRFLRFAATGRTERSTGWLRPLFLGVGCFLPGFLISFPVIALWASRKPGYDGFDFAFEISLCLGAATAIICGVALLTKHRRRLKEISG